MRSQYVHKTALICLIAVLLISSISLGNGQATGTASSTKKYVVFRCDDVAPKAKFAELQAVNQVHSDKNVPLTLGIVPHPTTGTGNELLADSQFASYMQSLASNHLFEFAQHGYTHQNLGMSMYGPSEFYGRSYDDQYSAIKKGRDDIRAAFGVTPTSFIPPFDKGDNNTLKAAKALGFTEYSTAFRDFNMNEGTKEGVHVDTASLVLANESLQSAEGKTSQFLADSHSIDTFVVLYHPADFSSSNGSVNNDRITLLQDYIDYLKGRGDIQFTTLDRSWTTGTSQQKATTLPSVQAESTVIGGLQGSWVLPLIGTILALALVAYLVLFRRNMKRR
ncbi:MAG: DUF2334 domain-containing protein [Halobacteriota archaeon]